MQIDEIQHRYQDLRRQLDAAYASLPWDSCHIDQITVAMLPLEQALAGSQAMWTAGDDGVGRRPQAMPLSPDCVAASSSLI